jgi:hypothetical protein
MDRLEMGRVRKYRRAKFYEITRAGKKQMAAAAQNWNESSILWAAFFSGHRGAVSGVAALWRRRSNQGNLSRN